LPYPGDGSLLSSETLPLEYQWSRDSEIIEGATEETLTLTNVTFADAGSYRVLVSNEGGAVTSGEAALNIVAPPFNEGGNQTILNGFTATLSVTLPEIEGYTFVWRKNGTVIDERNFLVNSQYFVDVDYQRPGALLGDANAAVAFRGIDTSKAEVFINDELSTPRFTVELWAMRTGGSGAFTSPLTFRDFSDTAIPPYRKGWLFYATDANRWQFRIGDGTATWVMLDGPPIINGEWTHLVGSYDGANVAFYVNGALVESRVATYAPIDPAQLPPLLRIGGGSTEDETGGFFFVGRVDEVSVYSNALTPAQIADHWAAAFSPAIAPIIDVHPQSTEVVAGRTVTLTVEARTGTPLSYQWKKDNQPIEGATQNTLTLMNADAATAGAYHVDVTNAAGTTESQRATIVVVGPEATYDATVLRDGPVAYWRLDETEGTTAADAMGNHPGTYGAGVILGATGALAGDDNTAASFIQAAAAFVEVPWAAALNPPQFTFECWAKVTGGTGHRSPMTSRGDPPQEGFIFYADPNNNWQFWSGTGAGWNALGNVPVQTDAWVHLAGTYDGTTKRFFVNGQEVGANQSVYVPNDADVLRLGAGATESPTGNYFFEGVIDEPAVYNKALSPARILTHYLAGQPPVTEIIAAIQVDGGEIVISWEGTASLEATEDLADWEVVPDATSPYRVTPSGRWRSNQRANLRTSKAIVSQPCRPFR
jgi:hypothetical protein